MTFLKNFIKWLLLIGGMIFWFTVLVGLASSQSGNGKVYDCTLAEISPDFPIEVKEECRRLNAGRTTKV